MNLKLIFIILFFIIVIPLGSSLTNISLLTLDNFENISDNNVVRWGDDLTLVRFDNGFTFNDDGLKFFLNYQITGAVGSEASAIVREYHLSVPYDISSVITSATEFGVSNGTGNISQLDEVGDILFDNDGDVFLFSYSCDNCITGAGGHKEIIRQYTLTSDFDLSTATLDHTFTQGLNPEITNCLDHQFGDGCLQMQWRTNGVQFFKGQDTYVTYTSAVFDISSLSSTANLELTAGTTFKDFYMFNDGSEMWIYNSVDNNIYQFSLSVPFDVSTAVQEDTFDLSTLSIDSLGSLQVIESENKVFILDSSIGLIFQLDFVFTPISSGTGGGSTSSIVENLNNIFPDSSELTLQKRLMFVVVSMVTIMGLFVGGFLIVNSELPKSLFVVMAIVEFILFFYFVAIGYIPVTIVIIGILLGVGSFYIFLRGGR